MSSFIPIQYGHCQFTIQYPVAAEGMTVCQNTGTLSVQISAVSPSNSRDTVFIIFPPGINYVPGSIQKTGGTTTLGISEAGGTPTSPRFVLSPDTLFAGDFISFTFERQADCNARFHALNGGVFKDTVIVKNAEGSWAESDPSINPYNILYPSIILSQPTAVNNTAIGRTYTRTFSISNGAVGAADAVHFYIVYPGAGAELVSLSLAGFGNIAPHTVNGDTLFFSLQNTQLGIDSLLTNGEILVLTENFRVRKCNAMTLYMAGWGCGIFPANWCQPMGGVGTITMASGSPIFGGFIAARIGFVDACTQFTTRLTFVNSGVGDSNAAAMYNVKLLLGQADNLTLTTGRWNLINLLSATLGPVSGFPIVNGTINAIAVINLQDTFNFNPGIPGLSDADGDGYWDDIFPGDTVIIEIETKINCGLWGICTNVDYWTYQTPGAAIQYTTMCSTGTVTSTPRYSTPIYSGAISLPVNKSYAPVNVYEGIPFRARFSVGHNTWAPLFSVYSSQYYYEITLPPGIGVAASGNLRWYSGSYPDSVLGGGTPVLPANIKQIGNVLTVSSATPNRFWFEIDLVYTCGFGAPGGSINVPFIFGWIQDTTPVPCTCFKDLFCGTLILNNVMCNSPIPCTDGGPSITYAKVERGDNSLGWTDNTLTTRQVRSAISDFDLSKALYLDTIEVTANGVQQLINSDDLFVRFEIKKLEGTDNKLTPIDIHVVVNRGGTPYSGTFSTWSGTGTTNVIQVMDWDISAIVALLPGGELLPADIIETKARYQVSSNTLPRNDQQTGERLYIYNKGPLNNELYCSMIIPEMYLVGAIFHDRHNNPPYSSCNAQNLGQGTHHLAYRFNYSGTQYLYEVRPGFLPTKLQFTVPQYYELTEVRWSGNDFAFALESLNPVLISGDTYEVVLPPKTFQITVENNYALRIHVYLRPTCNTQISGPNYTSRLEYIPYYYHYKGLDLTLWPTAVQTKSITPTYLEATRPSLALTDLTGPIQAYQPQQYWDVRLSNPTANITPNTWVAIPYDPNITITAITDLFNNPITWANYGPGNNSIWYKVGSLASAAEYNFRIHFAYTSCSLDSLSILAGWNCSGYPSDPSVSTCVKELFLKFEPQLSEVEIVQVSAPSDSVDLCNPAAYEYYINSSQAANTINNTFQIIASQGTYPVGNLIQVEYPVGAGNWQAINAVQSGNRYTFDLTLHSAYPSASGIPGTLSGVPNNQRQMGIRFNMLTQCDFVSGSSFTINTTAQRPCLEPAIGNSLLIQSPPLNISGVVANYQTYNKISAPQNVTCNGSLMVLFQTTITDGSTGTHGKAFVDLPLGMRYVTGSFGCNSSPNCPTFMGTSFLSSGQQRVTLRIPPSVPTATTLDYSMEVHYAMRGQCGINTIKLQTIDDFGSIACITEPSGFCDTLAVQTGTGSDSILIEMPDLSLSNFMVSASPGGSAGETVAFTITVSNSGLDMAAGQTAFINIYSDLLNNGGYDPGLDAFITAIPVYELNKGESQVVSTSTFVSGVLNTCRYIAVLDTGNVDYPSPCICSRDETSSIGSPPLRNAGPDQNLCAGNFTQIGMSPVQGYVYGWNPTTNLSDPNSGNPAYSSLVPGSYEYILTTTRPGGCASTRDTVLVTVLAAPVVTFTSTNVSCFNEGNGNITITASGGTPPYTYSIDNGVSYPYSGPSPFTINNLLPGLYQVRVRDANGCETNMCR
ncbi:MAG: SprB repeat-containing protein [Lentimicrobiaceae bacterium]|nr:SprB repeat-containing protein [Lentimicrobiaceae bacterium]